MKLAIIVAFFILSASKKIYAQNDHLEPVKSIFDEYDFRFVYHSDIRKILMNGMSDAPEVRFLIIPSFATEEVVAIEKEDENYYIIHHRMTKSIWYTDENKEDIKVQKTKVRISKFDAQLYIDLFKAAMSKRKYPHKMNFGTDGNNYYFSVYDSPLKTGTTWSPRKGTKMKELVDIGNSLIKLALQSEKGKIAQLNDETKLKINQLKTRF
ncbi:hypothetical protein LX97_02024 [Nonlabens dokdonensis]|uniref:Uncharacterized protein n=2 Tax=Nonlabens dokdonensis TaxID=328515 RepID=L7WD15_NONDD|nr:hypothetical protein [Nonlabens dokdonensis]AGC77796.1 hypothetical protein DDD_2669 [Nonlabens dokdonensis DSW-6]PZX39670.1 hypothetical protein LX97_02024 [Nonlabens dokdonensis]